MFYWSGISSAERLKVKRWKFASLQRTLVFVAGGLNLLRHFQSDVRKGEYMHAYELADLVRQQGASGRLYLEFLRVPSISMGVYTLPAGSKDPQQPHTEDEVYYVASGTGMIYVGGEDRPVTAGSIVYVAANVEHHFHSITEDLNIIVFFAPAEYTLKDK